MEIARLAVWLPLIFLLSYLAVGAVFALLAWLWPLGYLAIAGVIGLFLLTIRVAVA